MLPPHPPTHTLLHLLMLLKKIFSSFIPWLFNFHPPVSKINFCFLFLSVVSTLLTHPMGVPSRTRTHHLHFYIPGWLLLLQGRPLKSSSPATIWNRLLLSGPPCAFIAFCFLHFLISNTLLSVVFYPLPDLAFIQTHFRRFTSFFSSVINVT